MLLGHVSMQDASCQGGLDFKLRLMLHAFLSTTLGSETVECKCIQSLTWWPAAHPELQFNMVTTLALASYRLQSSCHPFQDLHFTLLSRSYTNELAKVLQSTCSKMRQHAQILLDMPVIV